MSLPLNSRFLNWPTTGWSNLILNPKLFAIFLLQVLPIDTSPLGDDDAGFEHITGCARRQRFKLMKKSERLQRQGFIISLKSPPNRCPTSIWSKIKQPQLAIIHPSLPAPVCHSANHRLRFPMAINFGDHNYQRFSCESEINSKLNGCISIGLSDPRFKKLEPIPKVKDLVPKSRIKTLIKILSNQKLNLIWRKVNSGSTTTGEYSTIKSSNNGGLLADFGIFTDRSEGFLQNWLLN